MPFGQRGIYRGPEIPAESPFFREDRTRGDGVYSLQDIIAGADNKPKVYQPIIDQQPFTGLDWDRLQGLMPQKTSAKGTIGAFVDSARAGAPKAGSRERQRDMYDRLTPQEIRDLAFTIAGEIDSRPAYGGSEYGTPANRQEIANIVQTIMNRAAERGLTPSQVVKQGRGSQYNAWLNADTRAAAQRNLKNFGPEIISGMNDFFTGQVQPTNTRINHYLNPNPNLYRGGKIPTWAKKMEVLGTVNQHRFGRYPAQSDVPALDAQREMQVAQARRSPALGPPSPDPWAGIATANRMPSDPRLGVSPGSMPPRTFEPGTGDFASIFPAEQPRQRQPWEGMGLDRPAPPPNRAELAQQALVRDPNVAGWSHALHANDPPKPQPGYPSQVAGDPRTSPPTDYSGAIQRAKIAIGHKQLNEELDAFRQQLDQRHQLSQQPAPPSDPRLAMTPGGMPSAPLPNPMAGGARPMPGGPGGMPAAQPPPMVAGRPMPGGPGGMPPAPGMVPGQPPANPQQQMAQQGVGQPGFAGMGGMNAKAPMAPIDHPRMAAMQGQGGGMYPFSPLAQTQQLQKQQTAALGPSPAQKMPQMAAPPPAMPSQQQRANPVHPAFYSPFSPEAGMGATPQERIAMSLGPPQALPPQPPAPMNAVRPQGPSAGLPAAQGFDPMFSPQSITGGPGLSRAATSFNNPLGPPPLDPRLGMQPGRMPAAPAPPTPPVPGQGILGGIIDAAQRYAGPAIEGAKDIGKKAVDQAIKSYLFSDPVTKAKIQSNGDKKKFWEQMQNANQMQIARASLMMGIPGAGGMGGFGSPGGNNHGGNWAGGWNNWSGGNRYTGPGSWGFTNRSGGA